VRDLVAQASYLDLHTGTSFRDAMDMPISLTRAFLEGDVHKEHTKERETRARNTSALYERLDSIIKGMNALGKGISAAIRR
jgi:hypothetical protein